MSVQKCCRLFRTPNVGSVQLLSGTIVEGGGSTTNDVAGRVNQGGRVTISFCSLQPAWEAHYSAPSSSPHPGVQGEERQRREPRGKGGREGGGSGFDLSTLGQEAVPSGGVRPSFTQRSIRLCGGVQQTEFGTRRVLTPSFQTKRRLTRKWKSFGKCVG